MPLAGTHRARSPMLVSDKHDSSRSRIPHKGKKRQSRSGGSLAPPLEMATLMLDRTSWQSRTTAE